MVLRQVVGLAFVAHGAQKLLQVFGGRGIETAADTFDQIGLRPSKLNAWLASLADLGGGLLIALGRLTPFAAAALIATMTAAGLTVHLRNGVFTTNNGYDYNVVLPPTRRGTCPRNLRHPPRRGLSHSVGMARRERTSPLNPGEKSV